MKPTSLVEAVAKRLWEMDHSEPWMDCPCPELWRKEAKSLIRMIEKGLRP